MPLLENGKPVADAWCRVADDEPLPVDCKALVTLARYRAEQESLATRNSPVGVLLKSDEPAEKIADILDRLALVAVEFPRFKDGRGFSTARELRERYGFAGEVRAVGHVIPDQHQFLVRAGFSTVEIGPDHDPATWAATLTHMTVAYQPGAYQPGTPDDRPLSLLRRHIRAGTEAV